MNLIDREGLMFSLIFSDETGDIPCGQMKKVFKVIKAQPLKTIERAHGWWIPVTNGRGGCECSLCHRYAPSYQSGGEWLTDYCPCCGAEMEGLNEENNYYFINGDNVDRLRSDS